MKYTAGFFLIFLFGFSKIQAQVVTQWTPFSDCSATCNTGNPIRTRTRLCTPSNLCQGVDVLNTTPCNTQYACPDYRLGDWGSWSACSESCRSTQSYPTQVRTRSYCLSDSTSTYQCTSNYMISYQPCNIVACSVVKSCNRLNFTFVFVLDGSSSVTPEEWIDEKMLVTQFVNSSAFGQNPNVDVAIVNFGTSAEIAANCGTFKSYSSFATFMNNLQIKGGGTAIHKGLEYAQTAFNNCLKLNMYPVVILLTDGFENIDQNVDSNIIVENQLKSQALVVAGAAHEYNKGEVDRITSYIVNGQNVSYAFYATNFTLLLNNFGNLLYPFILSKSQCQTQGQWTTWAAWSSCSVVCGATGYVQRSRSCINPTTNIIQGDCEPDGNIANLDEMTCSFPCSTFSAWSSWGACSSSCRLDSGPGITSRSRTCLSGLGSCVGDLSETQECSTNIPCQGIISSWGAWSQCSATCQLTSTLPTQQRNRICVGATLGGNCDGQATLGSQSCSIGIYCPGTVSDWSSWGSCSAVCNNLINIPFQTSTRSCIGYSTWDPNYTGCPGITLTLQQPCNTNVPCSGNYGAWSAWSSCSETCQSNPSATPLQTQTRQCLGATLGGGCAGESFQSISCNSGVSCPGILSGWSAWGGCSASCQLNFIVPQQTSTRTCSGASFGGNCGGAALTQSQNCNAEINCPGLLSGWSSWGACTASCNTQVNGPYQYRTQTCIGYSTWNPNYVGCNNAILSEQQLCNQNVPCQGNYGAWSAWGTCSETCQSNPSVSPFQTQTRQCLGSTLNGGCPGATSQTQTCNSGVSCPGILSGWSAWGGCSASCQLNFNVPQQTSTRTCSGASFGGNCGGAALTQTQNCNAEINCPGTLSGWSSWGACTASCNIQVNGPYQYRTQTCIGYSTWNPNYVGCNNAVLSEQQLCNQNIPCQGNYGAWSAWGTCSETCQSNPSVSPFQTQTRQCLGSTLNGGCPGATSQTQTCNTGVSCQGILSAWGAWGLCSASCQMLYTPPTQSSTRQCIGATFNGNCNGELLIKTQNCLEQVKCPGTISGWSSWGACSASCNNLVTVPTRTRSQFCIGYSTFDPSYKGCDGIPTSDQQACNEIVGCPGTYGEWSAWSICSETCQSNTNAAPSQTQTRQCNGATLGVGCVGPSSQTAFCNSGVACPGILSGWSAWGACSFSCQLGFVVPTQISTRTCSGGSLGANCNGQILTQTRNCNAEVFCPGTLSGWSSWSVCSASCNTQVNGPYQYRSQTCDGVSTWNPNYKGCNSAVLTDQQLCNQNVPCQGYYTAWSAWSTCSESCQSNVNNPPSQFHTRTCLNFTLNGGCIGASSESQTCNAQVSCPGDLTQWLGFSACSQSCQVDSVVPTRNRVRSCLNPTVGGNCLGQPLTDVQLCNAGVSCPGQLTDWTSWSQCPATCQQTAGQFNLQYRSRQCLNTSYSGNCNGQLLTDQTPCVVNIPCPGILSQWTSYNACSESCVSNPSVLPSQTRSRTCTTATLGANCGGVPLSDSFSCNANVGCPGAWTSWGPFTDCSASCQSIANNVPTQSRQRFCVNNTLNGACPSDNNGDKVQTVQCNVGVICPVIGTWGAWNSWSSCSASCDAGVIQRSRVCSTPYPPGAGNNCIGNSTQSLPCKLFDCPLSCVIPKSCNCSQIKQWSTVPTFDQFQSRNLNLAAIDNVLVFLKSYGDDTVNKACEACNTMMLTTLKSNTGNQLNQAKATGMTLEFIKKDLRAVINCNGVILNNAGLWSLYDLMFERATMLEGVIVELNAIHVRFDAALTSCQSYGWIHQTFKTILRKCSL